MDWTLRAGRVRRLSMLVLIALTITAPGCASLVATMMYRGRVAPAKCKELQGRRVAVVCTAESGDFGPNPNAAIVARRLEKKLAQHVEEIQLVDQQQIEAWLDENDTAYIDYAEIGKGVKADLVVAIEVDTLRLQDNATMYKGRCDYQLKVVDVANGGKQIYSAFTPPVIYPRISGLHTTSVTKEEFRQKFLDVLAGEISRHFYEHDLNDQIAVDTPDLLQYE